GELIQESTDKSYYTCLYIVIDVTCDEFGDAPSTDTVVNGEISPYDVNRFHGTRIMDYRPQSFRNISRTGSEISDHIKEIVGILVFATRIKGQGFENHICPGPANPYLPGGILPHNGFSRQLDLAPILERQVQARGND